MRAAAAVLLAGVAGLCAGASNEFAAIVRASDRPAMTPETAERLAGVRRRMAQAGARGGVALELPEGPNVDDCVEHDGSRVCVQNLRQPSCPPEYFMAAREDCIWLAHALNKQQGDVTKVQVSWWTTTDCQVHRTVCHADHSRHGLQYEVSIYDFRRACEETARMVFQFSYDHTTHGARFYRGAVDLKHGQEGLLISTHDGSSDDYHEEFATVRLFECNSDGVVIYKTEGIGEGSLRKRGDMTGMYAQIERRVVMYQSAAKRSLNHTSNYRVTQRRVLDDCPPDARSTWQALRYVTVTHSTTKDSSQPMRMWTVVACLVLMLFSVAVAVHVIRRRHCRRVQTQQTSDVSPRGGLPVVQGVVVEAAAPPHHQNPLEALEADSQGGCSAAPLPPQPEPIQPQPEPLRMARPSAPPQGEQM